MFIAAGSNADLSPVGAKCLCLSGQNAIKDPKLTPMVRLGNRTYQGMEVPICFSGLP